MPQIPQSPTNSMPRSPGGYGGVTQSAMDIYRQQDPVAAQSKGMLNPGDDSAFAGLPDWAKKTFQSHYGRQGQGQGELADQFLNQRDVGMYNQFGAGKANLQNPYAFNGGGMDPTQFNIFNNSSIGNNPYAGWNNQQFSEKYAGGGGDRDTFDTWAQSNGGNSGIYNQMRLPFASRNQLGDEPQNLGVQFSAPSQMAFIRDRSGQSMGSYQGLNSSGVNSYKDFLAQRDGSKRDSWSGERL